MDGIFFLELLFGAYIVTYIYIIVTKPMSTFGKVFWLIIIIVLPLIGAFFYHNTERPATLKNKRRFNPNFKRDRGHE